MTANPAVLLAKVMRREPESLARAIAQSVQAIFGQSASVELLKEGGASLAALFGGRKLFVFPLRDDQGVRSPAFLALDAAAAIHCAGASASLRPAQIETLISSGALPNTMREALGNVASLLCAAASMVVRTRIPEAFELRRGPVCKEITVGPWPALLAEFGRRTPWEIVACRLIVAGADCGALLFAASDGRHDATGDVVAAAGAPVECAETVPIDDTLTRVLRAKGQPAPAPTPPPTTGQGAPDRAPAAACVLVMGPPTDPATTWLEKSLAEAGAQVLQGIAALVRSGRQPAALFVVSRSPTDLAARLASALAGGRPDIVVACSDWATQDMVVAARNAGVDEFLVLPAPSERLRSILDRTLAPT